MTPGENKVVKVYIDGTQTLNPAADGVVFTSSDISVATVSDDGTIHAEAVGEAVITVTRGQKFTTISVVVQ